MLFALPTLEGCNLVPEKAKKVLKNTIGKKGTIHKKQREKIYFSPNTVHPFCSPPRYKILVLAPPTKSLKFWWLFAAPNFAEIFIWQILSLKQLPLFCGST